MATLVLVHGGLWEDNMDAERFWGRPGILDGLRRAGFTVSAPDRAVRAMSWDAEAEHLAALLPPGPLIVVAGSNGCSTAVALALSRPVLVERLLLAWPATAGDPVIDRPAARTMVAMGADPGTAEAMLAGDTLRGFTDAQLGALDLPVGVLPSIASPYHRRSTVDALLKAVPDAVELVPATPEPPRPEFEAYRDEFVAVVTGFATEHDVITSTW
ncbi:MAG: hypothetical protein QOE03_1874 [Micromonosporaceae bacterium]|nr:hypothetical protein [Micromonosporaceae bacterium]